MLKDSMYGRDIRGVLTGATIIFLLLSGVNAQTNISSCTTISADGEYFLNLSLINSNATSCINITSSNVIFDGAGYTIDGMATANTFGVNVSNSTTSLSNVTIKNLNVTDWYIGIYYNNTSNGSIINNSANSNNFSGIYILSSNNNSLINNTANSNNNYGIFFNSSNNNTIINNSALNNTIWDFFSSLNSLNNSVVNLTILNSTISFTSKDVAIKSASTPAGDPTGYRNIGKYINATNNSADSWLFLNVSYNNSDISGLNESTLRMWRYNGSWSLVNGTNGVETSLKYVFSNITNFSILAPMAESPPTPTPTPSPGGGGGGGRGGGSGGGGVVTGEDFANIAKSESNDEDLVANTPVTYTFKTPELGVYEIALTGKENELGITVRAEVLKGTSKQVTSQPPGTVYKNINLIAGTSRMIEARVRFRVENTWLASNSVSAGDVKLLHWDGSKWNQLDTAQTTQDGT
ncbi:MAG: PGF-pre-PGF domain-containing protein, partial [Candidatus Methanoperedens sp.]